MIFMTKVQTTLLAIPAKGMLNYSIPNVENWNAWFGGNGSRCRLTFVQDTLSQLLQEREEGLDPFRD
jgi:hypothetical protein